MEEYSATDSAADTVSRERPLNEIGGWRWTSDPRIMGYLFVAPAVIWLVAFIVVPALSALRLSFTNFYLLRPQDTQFIGLQNYIEILQDRLFWKALGNNIYFAAVVVPLQSALALALAVLLNRKLRGISFFRTAYFSPVITSMVVVSILWLFMYTQNGPINGLLTTLGLPPQPFIRSRTQAMPSIMLMSIWQGVGYQMVIFLAGLQAIPQALYEAAEIDGAGAWQRFRYVTLPMLRNTTILVLVTTTIFAFQLFEQIFVMTKGGPFDATVTVVYRIWEEGLRYRNVGPASAISVIFFLIVVGIAIVQRRYLLREAYF